MSARSITSPDFRYAPSKNIYWEKLKNLPAELQGLALTDHDTETHRGSWRSRFLATQKLPLESSLTRLLHVEVGCNAGHVSLEWAKQNPQHFYIGIDYKFKMIHKMAEKTAKAQVQNLLCFRANADRLPQMFAPGEIDYLNMFFPDPWPKKAQIKNRTADREWLTSIAPLLKDRNSGHGVFHLKTDHAGYFDFVLENLHALSDLWKIESHTRNLHEHHPDPKSLKIPEVTLFERLFIRDGLPIYSVKASRKPL